MMEYILILVVALALDVVLGEPPNRIHPVAGIGRIISWEMKLRPRGRTVQLLYGSLAVLVTAALFSTAAYFLLEYLRDVHVVLFVVMGAVLLKFTFSLRELHRAAMRVKDPLEKGNLPKAREQVGMIVSRKTSDLEEESVVSATVESVGEGIVDSFVAPLLYFLILAAIPGVALVAIPAAVVYRICNTFDSMVGYRGEYEYLGKFAARLDDVLNYVPARLAGFAVVLAAWIARRRAAQAWRVMWRDHGKTESPNAGWTMSATAGALGIQVEKEGHYRLGESRVSLSTDTIVQATQILWVSAVVWSGVCLGIIGGLHCLV